MKEQISNQEWILLSSYLDGELAPRQKARVERLLQTKPELARAYKNLADTRAVLRSTPHRKAPRNFTLTQAMLPQPIKIPRIVPVLRLSSAVAAILAVVLFGYQLLPGLSGAMVPLSAAKSAGEAPQEMLNSPMAAIPAATAPAAGGEAPIITWGEGSAPPVAGLSANSAESSANCLSGCGGGGVEPPPEARSFSQQVPGETPTPETTPEAGILSVAPDEPAAKNNGMILGVRPTEDQGKELDQSYTSVLPQVSADQPASVPESQPAWPGVALFIAGALAVLAIGLLAAAILIYRNVTH